MVAPVIAAVCCTCHDVVRKSRPESCDAAEADLERKHVRSAQNEPLTLIKDRAAILDPSREVRIIRILAGDIRIHVVDCVRPRIAREHRETPAETMRQIYVEGVIVRISVVHVTLNYGVSRLRICCRCGVACQVALGIPGLPSKAACSSPLVPIESDLAPSG